MVFNEKTQKWESPYWHPAVTTDAVVFGFGKEDKSLQVLLIKRGKAKAGEVPAFEGFGHYLVDSSNRTNQLTNALIENCLKNHI